MNFEKFSEMFTRLVALLTELVFIRKISTKKNQIRLIQTKFEMI